MSGIELVQTIEKIKSETLAPKERLRAIASLSKFDPNILGPNVDPLLGVFRILADRIVNGKTSEIEIFGAYLVQFCKLSVLIPKHVEKIVKSFKKTFERYPSLLKVDYVFVALLAGSKYLLESEPAIIFDEFIRDIIVRGLNIKSQKVRLRALTTLFAGLWTVPWALNYYFDVIKALLDNREDPLWKKVLEYLGVVGKRNFYALRSILDYILKSYTNAQKFPREVILFLADLRIPIREQNYIEMIGKILKEAIQNFEDTTIRSKALVGLANIYKHPKFVEEKKELLKLIRTVLLVPNFEIVMACMHALAIPQWFKVDVDESIMREILDYYKQIHNKKEKIVFLDGLLLVYSNLEKFSRIILEFLVSIIPEASTDMELVSRLFEVLSSIVKSEVQLDNIRFLMKSVIDFLIKPIEQFSVAMRTIIIERVLMPIAQSFPGVFVEFAYDIKRAYQVSKLYTIYESLSKAIFEALRKYNQVNEKSLVLLDILFDSPNLEVAYTDLLDYLVGLAKKYSVGVIKNIGVLINIYKIIRKISPTITDPRERYFVIDKALKDLVRVLALIAPSTPQKILPYVAKLLVAIFIGEEGTVILDVIYTMKQSKEIPGLFSLIVNELKNIKVPEEKQKLLKEYGIL